MKWQAYEELVKDIYQELGKATGVKIECWGPSCRVPGKSGEYHQIDVLASHGDGIHTYRTAIECKYWNNKISKGQVFELAGKIEDANIEKGILVSKCGFTRSALTIAKDKNISLVHLRKPIPSRLGWVSQGGIRGNQLHRRRSVRLQINLKQCGSTRCLHQEGGYR